MVPWGYTRQKVSQHFFSSVQISLLNDQISEIVYTEKEYYVGNSEITIISVLALKTFHYQNIESSETDQSKRRKFR
jgi:hypothetical protein